MPRPIIPSLELAQKLWVGISTGDPTLLREVLAPDVHWRTCGHGDLAGFYLGVEACLDLFASAGDLADRFHADLYDIYSSEGGAVLHYSVEVARGHSRLDSEELLELRIRNGQITGAVVVPLDQEANDRFWRRPLGRRPAAASRGAQSG